jgi:hypothetical protein
MPGIVSLGSAHYHMMLTSLDIMLEAKKVLPVACRQFLQWHRT